MFVEDPFSFSLLSVRGLLHEPLRGDKLFLFLKPRGNEVPLDEGALLTHMNLEQEAPFPPHPAAAGRLLCSLLHLLGVVKSKPLSTARSWPQVDGSDTGRPVS